MSKELYATTPVSKTLPVIPARPYFAYDNSLFHWGTLENCAGNVLVWNFVEDEIVNLPMILEIHLPVFFVWFLIVVY